MQRGAPLRRARDKNFSFSTAVAGGLIVLALLPYLLAEAKTGFRNTRAMFSHVESAAQSGGSEGARAAMETLVLAADPTVVFPNQRTTSLATGGVIALAALAVLALRRRRASQADGSTARSQVNEMIWLVATALVGVAAQALFFRLMARPLNGLHYAILLAPWYAIPLAALLAAAFLDTRHRAGRLAAPVLGVVAVLLLLVNTPDRADRFAERTLWNYRTIVTALDTLCAGQAVETVEGPGLIDELNPSYDSVLRYLMKRGFSRCHYDPQSAIVIAAKRSASFDESIEIAGRRFTRETVLPPGLARYRRVP